MTVEEMIHDATENDLLDKIEIIMRDEKLSWVQAYKKVKEIFETE